MIYYWIIEKIDGQNYNVGRENSEQEAEARIKELIAYDAQYGRDSRNRYSYSTNRYDC